MNHVLKSTLVALCVFGLIAFWIWSEGAERRAIRGLPPAERAAVYQRTLENFQSVCGRDQLALADYCRDQAQIVLAFPECDENCRKLASGELGRRGP